MPYTKQYTKAVEKVNGKDAWEDLPSKETPITAQCLDTIEQGVATNDERIVEMSQIYDKTAINMGRKSDTFGGTNSVAVGYDVAASGNYSSAVGHMSKAEGLAAHAEGRGTAASYDYAHAEGNETIANGEAAHAEGYKTTASGYYSHAEGQNTKATRMYGHAEGNSSESSGSSAHAEGESTVASGDYAHAEGSTTTASSSGAHAEGYKTVASNIDTHAEGCETIASGSYAHAEGYSTKASGASAHAEGSNTEAQGECSHVEGWGTVASPGSRQAHAEGLCTIASGFNQHVEGKYNVEDTDSKYAHIVGGGTADDNRKNIFTVDWNGNVEVAGDVKNGNGVSLDGLEAKVAGLPTSADTARTLSLDMDPATYVLTLSLLNADGETLSSGQVDLPFESMVVSASYENGKITLVLQSGDTLDVDVSEIVSGLVNNSRTIAGIDLKDDVTAKELKDALAYTAEEVGADPAGTADAAVEQLGAEVFKSYRGILENIDTAPKDVKSGCYAVFSSGVIYDLLLCFNSKQGSATALQVLLSFDLKKCKIRPAINNGSWGPWRPLAFADDFPTAMTGATADADGTSGLVPAPLKGDQNKFLRADGTWVAPPESTLVETDPTVPDWAKQPTKPTYTAAEVGADAAGAADKVMATVRNNYTTNSLTGVETDFYGNTNIGYECYDVASGGLCGESGVESLNKALAEATRKIAETIAAVHGLVPARRRFTIGSATAADSTIIGLNGIFTLRVYKISNDQLMAVNQDVYVSDTYGDSNTFVGKLAANTGALSNTYGTIAVSTADEAVKVASVKGYRIGITVMDCI